MLDILDLEYVGLGKLLDDFSVTAVALLNKNLFVCTIKQELLIQSLQNLENLVDYCLSHEDIWRSSDGKLFLAKFSLKSWMCFFKVKHYFGHIYFKEI